MVLIGVEKWFLMRIKVRRENWRRVEEIGNVFAHTYIGGWWNVFLCLGTRFDKEHNLGEGSSSREQGTGGSSSKKIHFWKTGLIILTLYMDIWMEKVRSRSKIVFPAAIRERNLSTFGAFSYSSNSAVTINPLGVCSILRTIPFRALILCALG